jgi:MbtH protein
VIISNGRDKRMQDKENKRLYSVVINSEEQYSIWLSDKAVPPGWVKVGYSGEKSQCLDYIKEIWQDIRPLSLRK